MGTTKLQIKRGSIYSMPRLANGELAITSIPYDIAKPYHLYCGTPDRGNYDLTQSDTTLTPQPVMAIFTPTNGTLTLNQSDFVTFGQQGNSFPVSDFNQNQSITPIISSDNQHIILPSYQQGSNYRYVYNVSWQFNGQVTANSNYGELTSYKIRILPVVNNQQFSPYSVWTDVVFPSSQGQTSFTLQGNYFTWEMEGEETKLSFQNMQDSFGLFNGSIYITGFPVKVS